MSERPVLVSPLVLTALMAKAAAKDAKEAKASNAAFAKAVAKAQKSLLRR